jgi:hypothetical protein
LRAFGFGVKASSYRVFQQWKLEKAAAGFLAPDVGGPVCRQGGIKSLDWPIALDR